jgi:hypothetical protein
MLPLTYRRSRFTRSDAVLFGFSISALVVGIALLAGANNNQTLKASIRPEGAVAAGILAVIVGLAGMAYLYPKLQQHHNEQDPLLVSSGRLPRRSFLARVWTGARPSVTAAPSHETV